MYIVALLSVCCISGLGLIVDVVMFLCCWLLWFCDSAVVVVLGIVFTAVLLFLVADCLCVVIWCVVCIGLDC